MSSEFTLRRLFCTAMHNVLQFLCFTSTLIVFNMLLFDYLLPEYSPEPNLSFVRDTPYVKPQHTLDTQMKLMEHSQRPFFLIWTTSAESFSKMQVVALESLLLMHPASPVVIFSNELPTDYFDKYKAMGWNISIRSMHTEDLIQLTQQLPWLSHKWLDRIDEWRKGKFFYSHITDFMRFVLLYVYGGTYTDFDVIWTRPVTLLDNAIAVDYVGVEGTCEWCLNEEYTFYEYSNGYIGTAVLAGISKGSLLMKRALELGFNGEYDRYCWSCVGPIPLTVAYNQLRNSSNDLDVQLLDSSAFWPLESAQMEQYFNTPEELHGAWDKIHSQSYAVHLFGRASTSAKVAAGSTVDRLYSQFRLTCDYTTPTSTMKFIGPSFIGLQHLLHPINNIRFVDCEFVHSKEYTLHIVAQSKALLDSHPSVPSYELVYHGTLHHINSALHSLLYHLPALDESMYYRDSISFHVHSDSAHAVFSVDVFNINKLLTVCIRSFGLHHLLKNSLASFRAVYPNLPILIVDDGRYEWHEFHALNYSNVKYLKLAFDAGGGAANNNILYNVDTRYLLLIDEGMLCSASSNILYLLNLLEHSSFDVLGMQLTASNALEAKDATTALMLPQAMAVSLDKGTLKVAAGNRSSHRGCELVDIVNTPFMGRTTQLLKLSWDPQIKHLEHIDLFLRAHKYHLHVGYCPAARLSAVKKKWYEQRSTESTKLHYLKQTLRKHSIATLLLPNSSSPIHVPINPDKEPCVIGKAIKYGCLACEEGFEGKECSECSAQRFGALCLQCICQNNGTCARDGTCSCPKDYYGADCSLQFGSNLLQVGRWTEGNCKVLADTSIYCNATNQPSPLLMLQTLQLNERAPTDYRISGWSSARGVSGVKDADYSVYVDIEYTDGTWSYAVYLPFSTGTHPYQFQHKIFHALKPVAAAKVHLLFREHAGEVRFKDVAFQRSLAVTNVSTPALTPRNELSALKWSALGNAPCVKLEGGIEFKCTQQSMQEERVSGMFQEVVLAQHTATAIRLSGYSKSTNIQGDDPIGYSFYMDIVFNDNSQLWGVHSPVLNNIQDYQYYEVTYTPQLPIHKVGVNLLFFKHSGTAWFRDVKLQQL